MPTSKVDRYTGTYGRYADTHRRPQENPLSGKYSLISGLRRYWRYLLPGTVMFTFGSVFWADFGVALLRLAPVSVELIINRVTAPPTLDLPPLNQRPTVYAQLELDDQAIVTGTVETPQIGADVYPAWALQVDKDRVWTEPGHPITAIVRIFDQDSDDADDKVLIRAIAFDPFACSAAFGTDLLRGDRVGSLCTVTIPSLQGESGSAWITLTAQW
ncbi:MAG: hypothetical protein F6K09_15315 [Merismopedia sp. SIO2A8]|nr:hypothetical protein [Merismopedia sp. SIO2A8]